MTLEEFDRVEPNLAARLRDYVGHGQHAIIMQVERVEGYMTSSGEWRKGPDWVAVIETTPSGEWEFVYEARCLPSCLNSAGRPRSWVYGDHLCCQECARDPGHYYQTVHE